VAVDTSLKPPTAEYLNSLASELGDLYLDDDRQLDDARRQREMRVPAMEGADQRYVLVHVDPRDPDVTEEAFQQTAIMTMERPKLTLKAGEGDTAQTNASLREHWTEEVLWECGTREPGQDTMSQCTDSALNDGGAWSKILYVRDAWDLRYSLDPPSPDDTTEAYASYDRATEDAKKISGPPFAWQYVDPRSIYPVYSYGTLCEVLEVTERPLRSTLRRYRLGLDPDGNIVPEELGRPQAENNPRTLPYAVTMHEHWDERWVTWSVAGTNYKGSPTAAIVKQFEHGYPFGVPYDFGPGLWMSYWRNRKVGWGISQTKLWLVKYRQYLRAMHAQYVARDLLSPLQSFSDSSAAPIIGNDGKPRERDPGPLPGEIINNGPGRQLARIEYPDPSTLEKHMSLVDTAIAQLESPKVTTLGGMEGAGFAISQVLSYSRTRVAPVSNGLQTLLKGQTEKLWDLARYKVKEKIYVGYSAGENDNQLGQDGYIGLAPKDFERPVRIQWEVQQQLPTDDMMRARYAHERLAAGTWGSDEAVEYLGDNPDEIRRSKERDRIRQTPQYQKWLDSQVFMFAGRGDILQLAQQASDLAQNGILASQAQPTPQGAPAPGVFEGQPNVPDLGALAAAPNGAGVQPPPGPQVMAAAGSATGVPAGGLPAAQQSIRY
jgi:hypothetical protein